MSESLAERFEAQRSHLKAVAYRMLGSDAQADDAVQESWLRLSRSESSGVQDLRGWLTTVVARVCLDMLRSRKARQEDQSPGAEVEVVADVNPEAERILADSVGLALLVVLETLSPAERVALVLHDMFDLPFEEIGPIVGRSEEATRQLASRARRRVRGAASVSDADLQQQRRVVDAFLAATRAGDFDALVAVLDPEVVLHADATAVAAAAANRGAGAPQILAEMRGARTIAEAFRGRARGAQPALIDGLFGAAWAPGGHPKAAFVFKVAGGRVLEIRMVTEPEDLARLEVVLLDS
jgi:RNA polymerase sigma-70 factor (ECF subfamily)